MCGIDARKLSLGGMMAVEVLEHMAFEMHNILSYRGIMTQQELVEKS